MRYFEGKNEVDVFKSILNTLPNSIYLKDIQGRYVWLNESSLKQLKYKHAIITSILGKTDIEVFPSTDATKYAQNDKMVLETQEGLSIEEEVFLPNGKKLTQLSFKEPFYQEKELIGVLGYTVDITEIKQKEIELQKEKERSEIANKIKMEFIRNMEHDLRTPFSGVWGLTSLLWAEETDAEKKELLGAITECAKELLDYCNELLDFTKIESGTLPIVSKKFDLMVLLDSVMKIHKPIAIQKKLEFQLSCDPHLPYIIIGDARRLSRILIHLVSNAIKFTHTGKIDLHVTQVKIEPKTCILRFIVKDTGIGFSSDQREYIYEKFTRLQPSNQGKYKGLGLGLRIVKQFMEEMEGEIDLASEPDKGTTFYCTLPFKLPLVPELLVNAEPLHGDESP